MALVDGIFLLPLVLPPTVVGFLLLLLFGRNGPLGKLFLKFGATIVFSWPATVIAATVVAFPLMYLTARAALEQVEPSLLQAARTLGASEWRVFREVALPLAWPGVLAGTILSFARALGEFGATLMLAGNIPGRTETIPIAIYFAVEANEMTKRATWCLIDIGISLVAARRPLLLDALAGAGARAVGSPLMSLEVQIEKKLPDFTLDVSFRAEAEPLSILGRIRRRQDDAAAMHRGTRAPRSRENRAEQSRPSSIPNRVVNIPARQRRIGMLFQNYAIFPHRTVAENIGFGLEAIAARRAIEASRGIDRAHSPRRSRRPLFARHYPAANSSEWRWRARSQSSPRRCCSMSHCRRSTRICAARWKYSSRKHLRRIAGPRCSSRTTWKKRTGSAARLLVLSRGRVVASGAKERIFQRPPSAEVARLTGCKNISRARAISDHSVEALDWGCTLRLAQPTFTPLSHGFVGIRAHHIEFVEANGASSEENVFPCWLVRSSETPFRITLFLSLQQHSSQSPQPESAQLQAEVYKEKWQRFRDKPFPWHVRLPSDSLFWMKE